MTAAGEQTQKAGKGGPARGSGEGEDYRLLLDRLRKAPLDAEGTAFVENAVRESGLLSRIDAEPMLQVALVLQQHGLIEQALAVYARLNNRFPDCRDGWRQHLELLHLLGDRAALVRVRAQAVAHVGSDTVRSWDQDARWLPAGEEEPEGRDITAPFELLRREEEQVGLFMRIFRGREDAFARQWVNRGEEKHGYVPVRRPMQPSDVRDHLDGHRTYGIYLLDRESRVFTGVVDVDLVGELRDAGQARKKRAVIRREALYLHRRIATLAHEAGLCCLAEVSGGKGYHFWFPVRKPVPAAAMRAALQWLVGGLNEDVECFSLEVFPKQDRRTGKGFGNLVKLPLGIHRATGKPSFFVMAADRSRESQFELLAGLRPAAPETVLRAAEHHTGARVLVHPRHAARAREFPELALLESRCPMLGQIMASLRSARSLSLREEKILLGTLGHLPRAGVLLHYLFANLPEYSRPLLDYKIGRVRGTVLGCKRIHSLLEAGADLPCSFEGQGYPHPLRHLEGYEGEPEPRSERVENLRDALACLKAAIRQVERFM